MIRWPCSVETSRGCRRNRLFVVVVIFVGVGGINVRYNRLYIPNAVIPITAKINTSTAMDDGTPPLLFVGPTTRRRARETLVVGVDGPVFVVAARWLVL